MGEKKRTIFGDVTDGWLVKRQCSYTPRVFLLELLIVPRNQNTSTRVKGSVSVAGQDVYHGESLKTYRYRGQSKDVCAQRGLSVFVDVRLSLSTTATKHSLKC